MLNEILVVVCIIGIVSSIVGIGVYNALVTSQIDSTKVQIGKFGDALEFYRMKFHEYPSTVQGLAALSKPPEGPAIIPDLPTDPWGHEYIYVYPGVRNPSRFEITSRGPDGLPDTQDDITQPGTNGTRTARAP